MAENDSAMELDPKSPEVMTSFYQRLFPFKALHTWLSHSVSNPVGTTDNAGGIGNSTLGKGPVPAWTHREFAFTLQNDAYLRYLSFNDAEELKRQVLKLVPQRFEIGAIYNARPRDKKSLPPGKLQPTRRELVFDIDMTDYDSIRQCCSGGAVCKRCWGFIAAAVAVLDSALRRDFGYSLLLWVYSGRRGIHCWVSDESAMQLTDEQRKAIMGWFEVIKGGKEMIKKVQVRGRIESASGPAPLPPALEEALGILSTDFFIPLILQDQDVFRKRVAGWEILLELIPDKEVRGRLEAKWAAQAEIDMEEDDDDEDTQSGDSKKSEKRWDDLKKEIKAVPKATPKRHILTAAMEDIVLQYTYPRIDAEVSKHRNHLLKAPFCVHPGTGRVCVPVDPLRVKEFDPEKVPSVGQLLRELDALAGSDVEGAELGWEHTSLKPYVEMMDEHNRRILQASRERKMRNEGKRDMTW